MKGHPNLAKLIGYCCEEVKGVVYELSLRDSLRNLMVKGTLDRCLVLFYVLNNLYLVFTLIAFS
jgi:hypothetical protein